MTHDNLVSVVMPAYNAARFIGDAVRSVLGQTFSEFELLVVDDCSRDATAEVVEDFVKTDSRVRLIRHARNFGPAAARNTALDRARGRYIAFLDSDDLWLPEKLEIQLAFMREQSAAICFTQFCRITEEGTVISRPVPVPPMVDYRGLLKGNVIATSTVLLDRTRTGPFRMIRTYYDDYALWLMLLRRGLRAYGLARDLVRYRIAHGSWSRNKLRSAYFTWKVYRDVEGLPLWDAVWNFLHYAWNGYRKYQLSLPGRGSMMQPLDPGPERRGTR